VTTLTVRGSCNPFKAADDLVKKLKGLQQQAAAMVATLPANPATLLECLTVGTADRASTQVNEMYDPYDLDSLKERVQYIFDGLSQQTTSTTDFITGHETAAYNTSVRTAGLWMSKDAANTFHGLVVAKTEDTLEDCRVVDRQGRYILRLIGQMRDALDLVDPATVDELKKNGDTIGATIIPELCALGAELKAISKNIGSSSSLGASYCGATSLQARIEALLRKIPRGAQPIAPVLRIAAQIDEMSAYLEAAYNEVVLSVAAIPAFQQQIEAGSHITTTEADLHQRLGEELTRLCDDMAYLEAQRKYPEMQRMLPEIQETLAITLDSLQQGPEQRSSAVQYHANYPAYLSYSDGLGALSDPVSPFQSMADMQFDLLQSVVGWNNDIREVIDTVESDINAILNYNTGVQTLGTEFIALAQEEVDQLCVGALRRLIALSGYKILERNFLYGLFGEFPTMAQESMTTAGVLSNCLKDLANAGNCFGIGSLPGPQRLAFERLSDVADVLQRGADFVGEVSQKVEGFQSKITEQIDDLVAAIESDSRAAIGGISKSISVPSLDALKLPGLPEIGGCVQSGPAQFTIDADGWVTLKGGTLPAGLHVDSLDHVFADEGVAIPSGFERMVGGKYLRALTPVVNPDAPATTVMPRGVPAAATASA